MSLEAFTIMKRSNEVMSASGKSKVGAVSRISGFLPMCFKSALMITYHKLKTDKQAYGLVLLGFFLIWVLNMDFQVSVMPQRSYNG